MEKINLNENEKEFMGEAYSQPERQSQKPKPPMVFAPQDGKPGYIINGKWYPVNPNELNSPQLKRDLERYARLRGQEQLKRDQEKLKSKSNSKPEVTPPESPNNTDTPDPTPLPTPPSSTRPPASTKPTSTSTSTSTPTSKPKIPTGVAVSPTTGEKTKFERRIPTSAELRAAQARRANAPEGESKKETEYQAVKAAVAASKTSTPISSKPTDTATKAATGGQNPRVQRLQVVPFKPGTKSEAYDVVLDYLLSEGHVDTVEEAHYVMLQMTSEHVRDIVEGEGYSNPSIDGNPIPYPKGHPKAGKPVSFNKAETKDMDRYRKASEKAGRKIYADEPLPKE